MLPSNGWANRSSIERMASPTSRPKRQRNPSTTLITVESSLITMESSRSSAGFARAFLFLGGGFGGGRRGPLRRGWGAKPPSEELGHARNEGIAPALVGRLPLRRVTVDEGPQVERAPQTTHLVLDGEELAASVRIDDVLEPVLVPVALLGDEPVLLEPPVRTREVRDVHLHVVTVAGRDAVRRLAEGQRLVGPHDHVRRRRPMAAD